MIYSYWHGSSFVLVLEMKIQEVLRAGVQHQILQLLPEKQGKQQE